MAYTLITGATGGIGKSFTHACAKLGYNLILVGRREDKLLTLREEILKVNGKIDVVFFTCDFSKADSRDDLYERILSSKLVINRLINVAGVDTQKAFCKYTLEKIRFQINVNFESVIELTHFVLSNFSEDLSIITISSLCAATPMPYFALYSATKRALLNFFKGIRKERDYKNVKITTVLPGSVPTRQDIVNDIEKQGLTGKLSKKSPDFVATKSLKAAKKNKAVFIPGFYNKVVYFFSKITPYCITSKIIQKKFSNKEKDAF